MHASPLYGRFQFGTQVPLPQLLERLKFVSARYLQGAPFHAYLTDRSGQTAYGLNHEALLTRYESAKGGIRSISTAATGPGLQVVRVHIHFDPRNRGRGQFVIAVGNKADNERIRALILGQKLPAAESKRLLQPENLKIPRVPRLSFTPEGQAFQKATVTLNDQFYFDRNLSIYTLLALLDEISDRYMNYRSFHAQLETTDGDFYFDIQREELRYLFNHRRHTLLALYLDVSKREGHWIDLMLSFHPLARGFNGEVEICAPGPIVDEINSLIWEALAVAPEQVEAPLLETEFDFEVKRFEVEKFIEMFEGLVARHLFRVPPVAELIDGRGRKYTGLSFFQLVKRSKSLTEPFRSLRVEVSQVVTGQTCQLQLKGREGKGSLRLLLGEAARQELLKNLLLGWFAKLEEGSPPSLPAGPQPKPERYYLLSLPWEEGWGRKLTYELENALTGQGVVCRRDVGPRETFADRLGDVQLLIIGFGKKMADSAYKVGVAHALDKPLLLLARDPQAIPSEFQHLPQLFFEGDTYKLDSFMQKLLSMG